MNIAAITPNESERKPHPFQRYPVSLGRASAELGYNIGHLSRVIRGIRISPPTLAAYNQLVAREGVTLPPPIAPKQD